MSIEETVSMKTLITPGLCTLLYGPFGVGKTDSLLTMPGKLLLYSTESKDIRRTIKEHFKRNDEMDREVKLKTFDDFDGYMDNLNKLNAAFENDKRPVDSIGFDTLSFFQADTKTQMEDDRFLDREEEGKRKDILIDRFRMEIPDWGGMKSAMIRLTGVLNKISKHGVYITCTSAMTNKFKADRTLEGAPDFEGGFQAIAAGFFDMVGVVFPGRDEDYPYPPLVSFNDPDYVTRCSSDKLMKKGRGVLDFKKILKVIEE